MGARKRVSGARKKLKAYVAPEKCSRYCCGWRAVEMARASRRI
jgi:hypothetical protein